MSKSVGNFITISDFLKRCPPNYLRFFVVKNLWRSPVDYSESVLIEIRGAVEKIEELLRKLKITNPKIQIPNKNQIQNSKLIKDFKTNFYKELADDFNTPKAFAVMFDFISKTNVLLDKNSISKNQANEIYKFFQEINKIFGIINFKKVNKTIPAEIKKLAKLRELHRKNKEWQKADEVRLQIEKHGFIIQDSENGPTIKFI